MSQIRANKEYIGDGVYVELNPAEYGIIVTTNDGFSNTNTIYLSTLEMAKLLEYIRDNFDGFGI